MVHIDVPAKLTKAAHHFPSDLVLSSATTHPVCIFPLVRRFFPTFLLQVRVPALTRISPDATACTPVILLGHGHLPPAQRQKMTCVSPALTAPGTREQALAQGWMAEMATCSAT